MGAAGLRREKQWDNINIQAAWNAGDKWLHYNHWHHKDAEVDSGNNHRKRSRLHPAVKRKPKNFAHPAIMINPFCFNSSHPDISAIYQQIFQYVYHPQKNGVPELILA